MDIQYVKKLLQIKTTKHDEYLTEVVPLFLEIAREQCKPFGDDPPAGVKMFVVKAVEFNMKPSNLKGRSMDTVSYNFITEVPRSVTQHLAPYRKLRVR